MRVLFLLTLCLSCGAGLVAALTPKDLSRFIWPDRFSAVQEVHLVSGNFSGAVQLGRIEYDFPNLMTREDQALVSGPSVKTDFTSDNMTEWFRGSDWYYMDWTTGVCQYANFGWGQVKPDFLVNNTFPRSVGNTFIHTYVDGGGEAAAAPERGYVNASFIHMDGSSGFGSPPGSSLFEYYIDEEGRGRRLRMPSSLSSDLIIELRSFERHVTPAISELPAACHKDVAKAWTLGPVTPLALKMKSAAAFSQQRGAGNVVDK